MFVVKTRCKFIFLVYEAHDGMVLVTVLYINFRGLKKY
jgi:hypothetical protein